MSDDRFDRMVERVRRLLALAEDPASSENEAELAYAQAQRIMQEHAIESWRLKRADEPLRPVVERRVGLDRDPANRYRADLARTVARANQCDAYASFETSRNHRDVIVEVVFVGAERDIEKAVMLWQSMELYRAGRWRPALRQARSRRRVGRDSFRNGFYKGFGARIQERFDELNRDLERDAAGRDLVLASRQAVARYMGGLDFVDANFPALSSDRDGVRAGRQAANHVGIGLATFEADGIVKALAA
ncbi:hypothetical protein BLEM_1110 [Bifidobacterium lemurum]|uniref:Uncharacterized protein n=1 Tax=Bifidobacterium lemurum TaxID=1603886 RepID=A0A261FTP3_9BIFI|nr:DUF2786 domain-containing protein [Bifidobacterium lemurum]OZG62564.1 hypothetical protein BLEM_1110 [Bifidobacterium lemurum]QOL33896.1 DUF2786 domain-containing protein [Bifidobacterium lemurum]